jgi:hypothetical protein
LLLNVLGHWSITKNQNIAFELFCQLRFKESLKKPPVALLITSLPAGRQGFRKTITPIFKLFQKSFEQGVFLKLGELKKPSRSHPCLVSK